MKVQLKGAKIKAIGAGSREGIVIMTKGAGLEGTKTVFLSPNGETTPWQGKAIVFWVEGQDPLPAVEKAVAFAKEHGYKITNLVKKT
jgi:hypothetical protein